MDSLAQRFDEPLPEARHAQLNTFVVFNRRRCVTSSAKRRRAPGSTSVAQTPDGSFLDLQRNAADLLARCGLSHVPPVRPLTLTPKSYARRLLPRPAAQRGRPARALRPLARAPGAALDPRT